MSNMEHITAEARCDHRARLMVEVCLFLYQHTKSIPDTAGLMREYGIPCEVAVRTITRPRQRRGVK